MTAKELIDDLNCLFEDDATPDVPIVALVDGKLIELTLATVGEVSAACKGAVRTPVVLKLESAECDGWEDCPSTMGIFDKIEGKRVYVSTDNGDVKSIEKGRRCHTCFVYAENGLDEVKAAWEKRVADDGFVAERKVVVRNTSLNVVALIIFTVGAMSELIGGKGE